jgi:hypothetical protein
MSSCYRPRSMSRWIIGMILSFAPVVFAHAATPLVLMQIHASRAVGSLAMYRGEGLQKVDASRVEGDLAALASAYQESQKTEALETSYAELVKQVRLGMTFGPHEEDVPWRFPEDLSKGLRDFLSASNEQAGSSEQSLVPLQIEYLSMQYLYRSYMGSFETARDLPDIYIGQDERKLVPLIDKVLQAMDEKTDPRVAKLKTRWAYLRSALSDMNSQTTALESASGRPFAPITVSRHSRSLTNQWLSLGQKPAANG